MYVNEFNRRIKQNASALMHHFWSSETITMSTFAVVVGLGAGLGTVVFIRMIGLFNSIFFGGGKTLGLPNGTYVILLPVIGGLIVGPLVHFVAPEAKGHGVPEVLTAIATKGGRIRPVVVLAKALGSAITIGSGGTVGREGPIVQIGAALGSTIGQALKLSERRIITLVASGAAAGIAATFNAPIAGVMFAIEILLGNFGIRDLSTLVISAVTASVVSRALLGDFPAFSVPAYQMNSPLELPLYLGLGILAGFGAIFFVKALYYMEDIFDNWKFPAYLKPAVGGLGLGLLGYFIPHVFGTGFDTISNVLAGNIGLMALLLLIFGKTMATTLTLGSGASGGVFAPALFIGAVLGGAYGQIAQLLFPGIPASSGAYAMVGMAAVFAGAARAPITAIIILFEMTQDYRIVLPLMAATITSTIIAQRLEPESIYTLKLKLRGIVPRHRREENPMGAIRVEEAMTPIDHTIVVKPDSTLQELVSLFQASSHHGFMVMEKGELYGIVTLSDLEKALTSNKMDAAVKDICTTNVITVFPDECIDEALQHFGAIDVGRIPVVEHGNTRKVIGVLRRGDIVHSLSTALVNKQKFIYKTDQLSMEDVVKTKLLEFYIMKGDSACGKRLKDIRLPDDAVIISIQRGKQIVVPRGLTQLLPGDRIIALAGEGSQEILRVALHEGQSPSDSANPETLQSKLD
jgi:CIC family chloride channel protein